MRRPDRTRRAAQLDLFRSLRPTPDWRGLPAEVREKATDLLARLLRERQPPSRSDRAVGGRDDE
jgi:hypothetical protein